MLCDALTGLGLEHGVDADRVWEASRFIDEHVTSQMPALPIPPRITLRTAFNRLPVGLVSDLDARLRMLGAADRLDEVLEEFKQVRLDCGVPPLAQPVGGILAGQAVRHVLSARRWDEVSPDMRDYLSGIYGNPPQAIAPAAAAHADPNAAVDPVTRPRPDAGGGAGRQRGGSAAGRAVRRRRQPAAGQRCAAAAIARMRSVTASSAASRSGSAS